MHALLHAGAGAPVHFCLSPTQPHHATLRTKREREKRCLTFFRLFFFGVFFCGFFFFLSLSLFSSISGLSAGGDDGEELNAVGAEWGKAFRRRRGDGTKATGAVLNRCPPSCRESCGCVWRGREGRWAAASLPPPLPGDGVSSEQRDPPLPAPHRAAEPSARPHPAAACGHRGDSGDVEMGTEGTQRRGQRGCRDGDGRDKVMGTMGDLQWGR